jgi:hypothetical protein
MTAPVPIGTPDWFRTFATSRTIFARQIANSISSPLTLPVLALANMENVGIYFQGIINPGQIIFQWFEDQALTLSLTTDVIEVIAGTSFDQTIPVKGPFATLQINPQGATPFTYTLIVYEAPHPAITQPFATGNLLIEEDGVSVPATSTTTVTASRVYCGPISIIAYSVDAASFSVDVQAQRAGGAIHSLSRVDQVSPRTHHLLYTPAIPLVINMNNHDAAARQFYVFVTAKPLYP